MQPGEDAVVVHPRTLATSPVCSADWGEPESQIRLAPDEEETISARILRPAAVLLAWMIAVGAPFAGVGGWAFTVPMLPLCI